MSLLKRTENGYFTLLTNDLAESREDLCSSCGLDECVMRQIIRKTSINRYNAILAIKSCKSFIPIFDFRDASGMERAFNTFRLGSAWMSRLKHDDTIALRSAGDIFGKARVITLFNGPFAEMDRLYTDDNHLAIQAAVEGKAFDMMKVMRNLYGSNRFSQDSLTTVIYLERLND